VICVKAVVTGRSVTGARSLTSAMKQINCDSRTFLYEICCGHSIIICLGRQTKQIMVAKFQTLMLLIANAESSPLFLKRLLPFICNTKAEKSRGDHCVNMVT
jgi:hypothetical protein